MIDIIEFVDIKEQLKYYNREIQEIKTPSEMREWIKKIFYVDMSIDETAVLIEFFHNSDEAVIKSYIKEQCERMTDEERRDKIIILNQWTDSKDYRNILDALFMTAEDKSKILDIFETEIFISEYVQELISTIDKKIIGEYLKNRNPINKNLVNYLIDKDEMLDVLKMVEDVEKTIIILKYLGPISGNISKNDKIDGMVHEIGNEYCRKQAITFMRTERILDVETFTSNILKYQKVSKQLEQITDEKEKVDFITTLNDNDLKLEFLKQIKSKEDRDEIISSLTKYIDPKIKPQVELVEKMIREFFEDKMGDTMRKEEKEKLDISFAKTSVMFERLQNPTNGMAYNLEDRISISTRHYNNLSKTILFLIHEYGHIFALLNIKTENYYRNPNIDEGMQDVFSELVINHWIEKYEQIKVNDRVINMEYPCKSYSAYNIENSWTRTMLYPLKKKGKDIEAVTEYLLGDKNKFLELTIGKENADNKPMDLYGNHFIDIIWKELYELMPEGFENDDLATAIYGRRNNFMPIFILQKKLEQTDINFFELQDNNKYNCTYIADRYFQGRKIYQISREEMAKFHDLYDSQNEEAIGNWWKFADEKINEVSEKEISEYSGEILESSIVLARDVNVIGERLENLWSLALVEERLKVEKGQSVKETAAKYKKIINDYMSLLEGIKSDESEYLMDVVKDLKYTYLQQMQESIKNGDIQELLHGLKDSVDGTIYVDTDILKLFETSGVKFEQIQMMGSGYTSQDIVDSAIRGTLKLDDIGRISVIFENDKSNELVGERENDE